VLFGYERGHQISKLKRTFRCSTDKAAIERRGEEMKLLDPRERNEIARLIRTL